MNGDPKDGGEARSPRPFIPASQRHDLVAQLARDRIQALDDSVARLISDALKIDDPDEVKLDGKNGSRDADPRPGGIVAVPWGAPPLPPKVPKGKESKEGKEAKDVKEGKDGKEAKDVDEGTMKTGGDEGAGMIFGYGDPQVLDWDAMNAVAASHPERLEALLKEIKVI